MPTEITEITFRGSFNKLTQRSAKNEINIYSFFNIGWGLGDFF